ncbi:MAG: hypothetical protein ACI808_002907, partial [Paraglaciecola sp.]
LKVPLLWSLHFSYWFIPISLGLFTLHYAGFNVAPSTALHGLTAGAISSLVLAMIARISLGHTGRQLQVNWLIKYAFSFVILAGVTRLLAGLIATTLPISFYIISAVFWTLGYSFYLAVYLPILTSPRPDSRPG